MIPKYITLKEKINSDILSNKYPIGTNLPTEVELADEYKVSRSTVRQALSLLVDQGIIAKRWGSGNTVISKSENSKSKTVMILLLDSMTKNDTLLSDMNSVLLKNGLEVEFHETKNSFQLERDYLSLLLKDVYAGLIIQPAHSNLDSVNKDLFQILLKRKTPIVFINSAPKDIYNATVVKYDHYDRGYQMARSLINTGHSKIGGIFINDDACSTLAFSGYVDAIRDANLEIYDNGFLFCYRQDPPGIASRSAAAINRFLKYVYENVTAVYCDDSSIITEGPNTLTHCNLTPTKSLGKESAKALITLKKNGKANSLTIPLKF